PKHYPVEKLEMSVYFSCSPDNVDMLTQAALDVITEVKQKGCDEKNLVKVKETAIRERQTSMKENQFWISSISTNDQNHENLLDLMQYESWVNGLTTSDMKQFASRYLMTDNYARFVLRPE
ncbi:MAG: hypothetical protein ACKO7B_00285, partial [Flavobacteriales bacterium]